MMRKLFFFPILALLLLLAGLIANFPEHAREYRLYLVEDRPELLMPYEQISQDWTEDDIRRKFKNLIFRCYDNRQGEYRGARSCFADIGSYNGHRAMGASFNFDDGRLSEMSVSVPWWEHQTAYASIVKTVGLPLSSQDVPSAEVRLHGWKLLNGSSLFYNRDRPINPLEWSGIYWRSERSCQRQHCWS